MQVHIFTYTHTYSRVFMHWASHASNLLRFGGIFIIYNSVLRGTNTHTHTNASSSVFLSLRLYFYTAWEHKQIFMVYPLCKYLYTYRHPDIHSHTYIEK